MSVENLGGDGYGDQPSIVYAFESSTSGEVAIRELSRSGFGLPGASPGDVITRKTTKSSPSEQLPALELPGGRGLQQDDCGEDLPAFSCASDDGCGHPIYVGRTCGSPVCERDWPAAVKEKAVRTAGKLEGLRRALYARYDGRRDIDFNHVVASLPSVMVDSEQPLERVLLILKTLLEKQWAIDGFVAIYHPYRIKQEYRKDQYDHGGEAGAGEMAWKDVLTSENPDEYLTFEPHFHTFFPAVRASFDYLTAEAVEDSAGWLFHRVTKEAESNVSVKDLHDLVHQVTYCYSHAGVRETDSGRFELASRLKGDLHNCYIPDGVADEVLAVFCEAAPKLLGTQFVNLSEATCGQDVSAGAVSGPDHDLVDHDHGDSVDDPGSSGSGGDPWPAGTFDLVGGGSREDSSFGFSSPSSAREATDGICGDESDAGGAAETEVCGGCLKPIHEAAKRLEDEAWCGQAEYVDGLRRAVAEWRRRTGGEESLAWTGDDDTDGEDGYPGVVQGG